MKISIFRRIFNNWLTYPWNFNHITGSPVVRSSSTNPSADPSKNWKSSKSPGSKWASPVSNFFPWKFENGRRERENNSSPFWAASPLVFRQLHFWLPFVSRNGVRCFWQHFTSPTLALSRQWATAPIYVNESLPTPQARITLRDHQIAARILHPLLSSSLVSFDRVKGPRGYGHRRFESTERFAFWTR